MGGTLSGITSGRLVLQNNAGDDLTLAADGKFSFATPIQAGAAYAITVRTQPLWQFCTVANGSGTAAGEVTGVTVTCKEAQAVVSTLAGTGNEGSSDGDRLTAEFARPRGVKVDAAGNLYVTDSRFNLIRKVSPAGDVETVGGVGAGGSLSDPFDLSFDAGGNIYVTELTNHRVRKVTPAKVVIPLAGLAGNAGSNDGPGASATFNQPAGIAIDVQGNLFICDSQSQKIRRIAPDGEVSTFAGSGVQGSDDGTGRNATFSVPAGVAFDPAGNMFVTDFGSHLIRKITPQGVVTTPFGKARTSGSADGKGNDATFSFPVGIAIDSSGSLYVADSTSHVIRRITPDGMVRTLAGTVRMSGSNDGVGTQASFNIPYGVAVDAGGNVYVADQFNHKIRKITPTPAP
ncbi:NHL repeat-containing protein [uncultured Variovorax sp.]|uniref:NHL repeat-containing protein n=1 Tax=uncultured Variovorax sp. TaxID=114708 RepID=UPI0025D52B9E|nr:NHL repeat-containing protein [uncultured Variovorax sp.]